MDLRNKAKEQIIEIVMGGSKDTITISREKDGKVMVVAKSIGGGGEEVMSMVLGEEGFVHIIRP
jgi:hypothetical protein